MSTAPARTQVGLTGTAEWIGAKGEILAAIGFLSVLGIMIVPVHPAILDILLTLSITSSLLILLITVYVQRPVELSVFPTVLLLVTLFRLSLNVASTRLILLHGNAVSDPDRIAGMVRQTRAVAGYRGQPILFNEDDHFDFDRPQNNFVAAVGEHASWGFFDFRMSGEGFNDGYQSVPVNWGLSSPRKRAFFDLLAEITGSGSNSPPTRSGSP